MFLTFPATFLICWEKKKTPRATRKVEKGGEKKKVVICPFPLTLVVQSRMGREGRKNTRGQVWQVKKWGKGGKEEKKGVLGLMLS